MRLSLSESFSHLPQLWVRRCVRLGLGAGTVAALFARNGWPLELKCCDIDVWLR